jgi:t-SNARE complex subunit (syntaxin)
MSDPMHENEAARKARQGRNIALFVGLVAFVILIFIVTITRLGGNVAAQHGF